MPRAYVVAIAAAVFALLVVQFAIAGSGAGASDPRATASATVRQQLTKLKRQVQKLRAQVAGLSNQQGQPGPQGPPGPPGPSSGPAGGDLTGNYPNPEIRTSAVTTAEVLIDTLTANDLATDSVGTSEVQDQSLTQDDLGPASVGSSEVVNNSLGLDDLSPNSVASDEIVNGSVGVGDQAVIPTARVRRTTNQTIESSQLEAISFTAETWDTFSMHSNVTNNTRLTAPFAGVYLITGNVLFNSATGGLRELSLEVNGNKPIADVQDDDRTSASEFHSLTTVYRLAGGDFGQLKVLQSSGGNVDIIPSSGGPETSPEFSMTWLGPA